MVDLTAPAEAFLTSFVLVVPFAVALQPRLLSLVAGATFVALGALLIEVLVQDALSPEVSAAVVLVFVAPLTEELLKFFGSGLTGANFASAAGRGLVSPRRRTRLYFFAAWGEPLTYLVALIALRAATDPTYPRHRDHPHYPLLARTAVGPARGACSFMASGTPWPWSRSTSTRPSASSCSGASGFVVLGILLLARRSPDIRYTLSDEWRMNPWTGSLFPVSAA